MENSITKRDLILAGSVLGISALATSPASPQQQPLDIVADIAPETIGQLHGQMIYQAQSTIVAQDALSRDSIMLVLQKLRELGVLSEDDVRTLERMIDIILSGSALDQVAQEIEQTYQEVSSALGEVAKSIAAIIRSSVSVARELLSQESIQIVIKAVSHDIRGALDGAVGGYTLFGARGALLGAFFGASTASIIGFGT